METKEKGNTIYLIIIIVCTLLVVLLCAFAIIHHGKEEHTDAMKFKNEYESLNDVESPNSDNKYPSVSITSDNPIVYKTAKEILEVLDNEDAIIYFGYASCPWCRNLVEVLLSAAKKQGVEKIYYVDIKDQRDAYEFSGTIKPKQTKKGSDAYYKILEFFGEKLETYYVRDEAGNQYSTGVTRLYAPTVIRIEKGKIMAMHVSTVESQTNPYEKLNEEQRNELYDILDELVQFSSNEVCKDEAC
ncbi:MAG: hypothetical protein K2M17_03395 [Bacilli bacterium]|nr:hypothetical protein [Bacilli bacterium]